MKTLTDQQAENDKLRADLAVHDEEATVLRMQVIVCAARGHVSTVALHGDTCTLLRYMVTHYTELLNVQK